MMPRNTRFVQVFVFTVAFIGCDAPLPSLEAVPGERIGAVEIGAPRTDVATAMGIDPTHAGDAVADSLLRDEWVLQEGRQIAVLYFDDRVVQVRADGPAVSTLLGVSTQSTLAAIREAYPNTAVSMMAHEMESMYFDDVEQGIAFSARTEEGHVLANPEGDVISIYVHEPGREVIAVVQHHH